MAKRDSNGGSKVSGAAFNTALSDINSRFEKLEGVVNELVSKVNSKVSVKAWNKANEEINDKFKSKVSVKAWETGLVDMDKEFKSLALSELKELDNRLDKTVDLINNLTNHLSEKVNMDAWDNLADSNRELLKQVNELKSTLSNADKRLVKVESMLKGASVTEAELKTLLESI